MIHHAQDGLRLCLLQLVNRQGAYFAHHTRLGLVRFGGGREKFVELKSVDSESSIGAIPDTTGVGG
jgi:hypothetical protein